MATENESTFDKVSFETSILVPTIKNLMILTILMHFDQILGQIMVKLGQIFVKNFKTVDAQVLAKAQQTCPNTAAHRAGKCLPDIQMRDVEYSSVIVLYCDISTGKSRPLVPLPMQNLVMGAFHSLVHPGQKGTLQKVNARYYWPNLPTDVSEYVKTCNRCQQSLLCPL